MASSLNYGNTLSPKTARSVLVPPDATNVPAPIVEANKPAVEKVEALDRAGQAVRDARRVAGEAPRRDEAARVAAHQADKKLPAPTVAKAREAVEIAERTRDLCRREADRAICHLHEVIATHQREWLDVQEPVTDDAVADLADLIDQLEHGFATAAAGAGIERGLRAFDPRSESPKLRTLAQPARTPDFAALRSAAAELVGDRGRTRLEGPAPLTPEQESLRDSQRTLRQFASGGVYVGGGSG
jgi:hypothetical protein